jgi:hypothetical protein
VTVEHWPKNSFSLESLPGLLASLTTTNFTSAIRALFDNETIDQSSIDFLISNLSQSKLADSPHLMLAMDEMTALELIVRGE